jgi:hypothetical protein
MILFLKEFNSLEITNFINIKISVFMKIIKK